MLFKIYNITITSRLEFFFFNRHHRQSTSLIDCQPVSWALIVVVVVVVVVVPVLLVEAINLYGDTCKCLSVHPWTYLVSNIIQGSHSYLY